MNIRISKFDINNKKDNIKLLLLLQIFVIMSVVIYFSLDKLNLIDTQYHPISGKDTLMVLLVLSGLVGAGSIFLFNELVKLIDKENEYELKKVEIIQMQETNDLLRSQKHDFSNNLQVIWGMLSLGKLEKAKEYLAEYTSMLKIDEEELEEIKQISDEYIQTLFINKCYKCKDMEIDIHYSIDPSISLEGFNPIDLNRIFGNLIDNAIYAVKALEKQYRDILVDIYCEDQYCFFSITNKGPQIPYDLKEKIFERGFTTKGNAGSGIGLYNVRQITNKYSGKVWVESNDCIGTQFVVQLPKKTT